MAKKPTAKDFEQKIKRLEEKVESFGRADEALAESELKWALLVKNLPSIVYRGFKYCLKN